MIRLRNNGAKSEPKAEKLLGAFTELRKVTIRLVMSVFLSVRPHGITRLPLDEFS